MDPLRGNGSVQLGRVLATGVVHGSIHARCHPQTHPTRMKVQSLFVVFVFPVIGVAQVVAVVLVEATGRGQIGFVFGTQVPVVVDVD